MAPAAQPPVFGIDVVAERITVERMGPYLDTAAGDLSAALSLYDWNSAVAGTLIETLAEAVAHSSGSAVTLVGTGRGRASPAKAPATSVEPL